MNPKSLHYTAEFWDVGEVSALDDVDLCKDLIKEAVNKSLCTLIQIQSHKFKPHGLSVVALLSESHCSIHTWPEEQYCAIDFYACGTNADIPAAITYLQHTLRPKHVIINKLERGVRHG